MLRAYDDAGLRALVCLGAQDRAHVVYPEADEAEFERSLPDDLRDLIVARRKPPYAPDAAATIATMDRLWSEWSGHARLSLGYGPSGPQWLSDGAFEALAKDAAARGTMLHYHCLESWTQRAACDRLYPEGVLARLRRLGALHDRVSLAISCGWMKTTSPSRARRASRWCAVPVPISIFRSAKRRPRTTSPPESKSRSAPMDARSTMARIFGARRVWLGFGAWRWLGSAARTRWGGVVTRTHLGRRQGRWLRASGRGPRGLAG